MAHRGSSNVVRSGDLQAAQELAVRPIANSRDLFAVYHLANDYFQSKGFSNHHPDGIWASHPDFDHSAETTVLVAVQGQEIVGSVTLTRDGHKGLTADELFAATCASIRSEGKRLGEVWRLVAQG